MLPKHFRWTVVQSIPKGPPDKQFRFYLHVILAISDQYITFLFEFFLHKIAAILDDRKSLLIAISDQYATFFFKMADRPSWMTNFSQNR